MKQELRLWNLNEEELVEIQPSRIDYETKLEDWVEADPGIVKRDMLIIGRQVKTDFGRFIDLLGIDANGDLIILELKKEKTPSDVTSQILDYASWVKDLSSDQIEAIADKYFKSTKSLADAFQEFFGSAIPEIINENHSLLVVASHLDNQSERVIQYLSETYGISINAATFSAFNDDSRGTMLARIFLIEPEEEERSATMKRASKRFDNYSVEGYLANWPETMVKIFNELKKRITAFGDDIEEKQRKLYTCYRTTSGNFVEIEIQKKKIIAHIDLPIEEIDDPKGLCRDVRSIGHWATGETEASIKDISQAEVLLNLIEQSYLANK